MTKAARNFISKKIKILVDKEGYKPKRAVAAAFNMARARGFKVPKALGIVTRTTKIPSIRKSTPKLRFGPQVVRTPIRGKYPGLVRSPGARTSKMLMELGVSTRTEALTRTMRAKVSEFAISSKIWNSKGLWMNNKPTAATKVLSEARRLLTKRARDLDKKTISSLKKEISDQAARIKSGPWFELGITATQKSPRKLWFEAKVLLSRATNVFERTGKTPLALITKLRSIATQIAPDLPTQAMVIRNSVASMSRRGLRGLGTKKTSSRFLSMKERKKLVTLLTREILDPKAVFTPEEKKLIAKSEAIMKELVGD
jgi:hypothetical protein